MRALLNFGYLWLVWCVAFTVYLLATHDAAWKPITTAVCAFVTATCITFLRSVLPRARG